MTSSRHSDVNDVGLSEFLRLGHKRFEEVVRGSIILNPVESIVFADDIGVASSITHGLYNTDKVRTRDQRRQTDHQFAGRDELARLSQRVYQAFAKALKADAATLRLLSGLNAHQVLFMSLAEPGQTVLLLPVKAGGHTSGAPILERLGLRVVEMVVDLDNRCIDIDATLNLCPSPDFVMVDRSEGIVIEDFSALANIPGAVTIFDASQYLTHVITGDHPNPFDIGFDLILSSTHKNFPGPQKALIATRTVDETWQRLLRGISTHVSNMDVTSTIAAGLTLSRRPWLDQYSKGMLAAAVSLEDELAEHGVPTIRRDRHAVPTHHLWISEPSRDKAFNTFEALERARIMTNFRKLPYDQGLGLRLGVNTIVRQGIQEVEISQLAMLIAEIRNCGPTPALRHETRDLAQRLWARV